MENLGLEPTALYAKLLLRSLTSSAILFSVILYIRWPFNTVCLLCKCIVITFKVLALTVINMCSFTFNVTLNHNPTLTPQSNPNHAFTPKLETTSQAH